MTDAELIELLAELGLDASNFRVIALLPLIEVAWVDVDGFGWMPLKTSPSGGARHAVEAYVAVRRVDGLTAGIYHYEAASHRLVRLRRGLPARVLAACVPEQTWMAGAPALGC